MFCFYTADVVKKKPKVKKQAVKRVMKPVDRRKGNKTKGGEAVATSGSQDNIRLSQNVVQLRPDTVGVGTSGIEITVRFFCFFWCCDLIEIDRKSVV